MSTQDLEQEFEQALNLFLSGQHSLAEIICQGVVQQVPYLAEAHNLLALIDFNLGKQEKALLQAEAAVRLSPKNSDFMISLGDILLAGDSPEKAAACYSHVLARHPNHHEALEKLSLCTKQAGPTPT